MPIDLQHFRRHFTSQGKDGIYSNWHVINYYGTISPGETITISASALREKPKPVLPYTGYKPSTLRVAVTVSQDWWYADKWLEFEEVVDFDTEEEGPLYLSYTVPEDYADNQITAFAYMTFGSNFQGYPYGNQSDYIVRVIYDVVEATSAPAPAPAPAASGTYDLTGEWSITANNYKGRINITNQSGSNFSGTVNLNSGKTEKLTDGLIAGNTVTFIRKWDSGNLQQEYTGTLSVDSNGNAGMSGTFSQNGSYSWNWSASKTTPISTPATPDPVTPAPSAGSGAEPFESGARIMWQQATGIGYRLFRSSSQNSLGISVTDFYLTSTSYADVNVESNTTYYYTVKPVLAEAKPFQGIEEKLGNTIATFTVKTGNEVYKPGSFKHFILLQLDNPNMSVDGISQEVDPGRGTTPIIISGRTMVPIRAVVEAMGGTLNWEQSTRKITLEARGNKVDMWIDKTDLNVNGASKKADVAPVLKNERTLVPLRFAAENLDAMVYWLNSTKEAVIVYVE